MAPRERFNQELALLHKEIVDMGAQVHGVLRKTIKVLRENDTELAESVVRGDFSINAMERRIEQLCLRLITRESPIAGDLRAITGTLKIITDLERTADQCADICEIMGTAAWAADMLVFDVLLHLFLRPAIYRTFHLNTMLIVVIFDQLISTETLFTLLTVH